MCVDVSKLWRLFGKDREGSLNISHTSSKINMVATYLPLCSTDDVIAMFMFLSLQYDVIPWKLYKYI